MDSLTSDEITNIIEKVKKSSNPRELSLKGLYFGRLCFKSGSYNDAIDWIAKYLQKFDRDFQAYKLLGECYEKLSKLDQALGSYKQSLQIKPNQNELVIHVTELFLHQGPSQNLTKAKIWLDKAAVALPGNPTVFKLKMKLLSAQQASPKTIENAFLKELKVRPTEPLLHVDFVHFLKSQNRFRDAFDYCNKQINIIESQDFHDNCKWYSCLLNTFKDYIDATKVSERNAVVYCLFLETVARYIWLCIDQNKYQKAMENLSLLDGYLLLSIDWTQNSDWYPVVEELRGQFSWLVGTLSIYQAQVNKLSWEEACQLAGSFYSYSLSKPLLSTTATWAVSCSRNIPRFPIRMHKKSAIRISQCSHMTWILNNKLSGDVKTSVKELSGPDKIGKFAHSQLCASNPQASYLCSGQMTCNARPVLIADMLQYDELAALSCDLHMLVWLGIRWVELEEALDFLPWTTRSFPFLKLETHSSSTSVVLPAVSLLDVEAFIAGCVFSTQKRLRDYEKSSLIDPMSLFCSSLPSALSRTMTTALQDKWWGAALKLSSKHSKLSIDEAAKLKPLLQRGLECIRGVGNHGLDTVLLTKLAQYFASKAFSLLDGDQVSSVWFTYQRKAVGYWSLATSELTLLSQGQTTRRTSSKDKLFPSVFKEPSLDEAEKLLSEAYMCRGELAAREDRSDDALTFYGKATIPQASFCQAHVYRKLLDSMTDERDSINLLSNANRKRELLTKKYRHCLEVTLSRLQRHPDDRLHEKTIQLLRSPHVSPPRPSMLNKSVNESVLSPSKQSTPKADTSNTSEPGKPLLEKEAVNNLVDTITTLTSALSSLQLEMEYLREENRLIRQSSPAQQGDASRRQAANQPQVFTSSILPTEDQQRPPQVATPQRPVLMPNPTMLQSYAKERNTQIPAALPQYHDVYQHQSAAYFSPSAPIPVANFGYPSYADSTSLNGYNMSGYSNFPPVAHSPSFPPINVGSSAPSPAPNLLATVLQSKDKEALQQKFSSMLTGNQSMTPINRYQSPLVATDSKPASSTSTPSTMSFPTGVSSHITANMMSPAAPVQKTPGKCATLEQLLVDKSSVASPSAPATASEAAKQNLKVDTAPRSTPTSMQHGVQFLDRFVSPKSPGTNMKFQSPEQMDRENQELEALEQADANTSQNADSGPHFDPIIPLPDLVEVKTGEEDEQVLFEDRCKLFRFDKDQWKERGLGTIKLLRHKSSGKARLVMRREQVLKVCCNHYVTDAIRLSPMPKCNRAMIWSAHDFSDDEAKIEKFAAKFRSVEIAEKFRDLIHAEAGRSSKPNESERADPISDAASKFKLAPASSQSTPAMVAARAVVEQDSPPKPSPFSNIASTLSSSGFGLGSGGSIRLPTVKYNVSQFSDSSPFSADKVASPKKQDDQEGDDDKNTSGPHFKPIIALPGLVEVKSGEEEEEVIFCKRAKLFIKDGPEWKERGVGELKILRHSIAGRHRIVMRREQVLKLCANQPIVDWMQLIPQGASNKTWIWVAFDFSESSTTEAQKFGFAVRFKTVEESSEFHDKFMEGVAADRRRKAAAVSASSTLPHPTTSSQAANAFMRKELNDKQVAWSSFKSNQSAVGSAVTQADVASSSATVSTVESSKAKIGFGFNLPPKPVGSWTCPDCCVTNPPTANACPCCNCPNPNAPKDQPPAQQTPAAKNDKFILQFGTGMTPSNTASSKFIFGQSQSAQNKEVTSSNAASNDAFNAKIGFGFNLPPKPVGSWTCPDCCVTNPPTANACPCCNCPNPNASKDQPPAQQTPAAKNDKFILQFGTGMTPSNTASSKFIFGQSQSTPNKEQAADSSKHHLVLQRVGGIKSSHAPVSQFVFGAPSNSPSSNSFSSSPAFGDFTKSTAAAPQQTKEIAVPYEHEHEYDDDEDDESDTTETSETYSDSQDDDDDDGDDYEEDTADVPSRQSPMSKFTSQSHKKVADEPATETRRDTTNTGSIQDFQSKPASSVVQSSAPFSFGSSTGMSFGQLAASGNTFSFKPSAVRQDSAWKPDTKPMFSHLLQSPEKQDGDDQVQDDDGDDIYVKPIVELPPAVKVETGEENETTLFSKRSKLYRWVKETSEWKERGIGDLMIKHDASIHRFRVVMRREQVLKVCANHYITPDMKLEPSFGSQLALTWLAFDYADGEEKVEKLAAKFKSSEIAQQFKEQFEECQKKSDVKQGDSSDVSKLISDAEKMKSELGFFKDKLSVQPDLGFNKLENSILSSTIPFDPKVGLTPLVKQHELNKEKEKARADVVPAEKSQDNAKPTTKSSLNLMNQFAFTFDPNSKPSNDSAKIESKQERNISICSATSEEADIHIEPIIPLPPKINVPTGEENEQIIFEDRTKVYVFDRDMKQWKDRGVGKTRLLQNPTDFKFRLVMRREQVLKVCLNHFVTDDINFSYKENTGGKVLLWAATDFSDTEKENGETLQLAMRFKDPESAAEFLRSVEDGVQASNSKRLLDPVSINLSRSSVLEQSSEAGDQSIDQSSSPVKSPQKTFKPLFSFDNVENPFNKKDNKFESFSFGSSHNANAATENRFAFDASAAVFNFGCATSTPMQQPPSQVDTQAFEKDPSKSLFPTPGLDSGSSTIAPTPLSQTLSDSVSHGGSEPGLCVPGAAEELRSIEQSSVKQPAAPTSTSEDNRNESKPSSEVQSGQSKTISEEARDDVGDDVIFVNVLEASSDQMSRAEELLLPKSFYLYENLSNEECDSEEEDRILDYIRRRDQYNDEYDDGYDDDEEDNDDDSEDNDNDESSDDGDDHDDGQDENQSSVNIANAADESSSPIVPAPSTVSSTHPAPQLNIFQSFPDMSDYSFTAMAASSDNKHAFGSRVDAAFQVSDEKKVLFGEKSEEQGEEEHDPHYKPLLSELPPLVSVATGEENEEVMFKERCKLYRFDEVTSSWKERGLGEMKILHHPEMDSYRVVMRREQVLKICANHRVTKEMSLIPTNEKAWMYVAQNKSDGEEAALEKLLVKFKNEQIAQQFKSAWDKARSQMDQ